MKTLDKYLLSQFLKVLSGSLLFMAGLYLIMIYLDNLKYFAHPNVKTSLVLSYILNVTPEILILVLPPAALFSTSYIFGTMNSTNEIIAVYNGRIGFMRLISPLIILGLVIAVCSFFFFEFVSAESSNKAFEIRDQIKKHTGKTLRHAYSNSKLFLKGSDGIIYYVEHFDSISEMIQKPVIFKFNSEGTLVFQLSAVSGIYDETGKIWNFNDVNIINYDGKDGYLNEKHARYSMKLKESPKNFLKTSMSLMQMRYNEALEFIESKRRSGSDYKKYLVEFHWRFSFPFSVVITILIGCVAGIYFRKAVLVLSFFLSIILSFGYYGILALGIAYGKSGKLDPVSAAWIANVIFFTGGIAALRFKK
ncbi:MAG: LptF/LptG family permease [Spirochaetes bacterium]|nr:LptF/LptG family permease [Spirochaetota bacterium]